MNYVVDKVKGGVKRGCVHFDTPSFRLYIIVLYMIKTESFITPQYV